MRRRSAQLLGAALLATTPSLKAQSTYDGDVTASGHNQIALAMLPSVAPTSAGGWLWIDARADREVDPYYSTGRAF
jgi:hypothetical protein